MGKLIISAAVSLITFCAFASFVSDFQSANNLFYQRKWPEAAAAFKKLAENAPAAHKNKCLVYQSRALASQKKYAEAMAVADKITGAHWKAFAQMNAMFANGKQKELLAAFAEEKIEDWPEEIDYLGHKMRGNAYYSSGNYAEAVCDLENAVDKAGSDDWAKGESLYYLVCSAEQAGDTRKALEAADKMLAKEGAKGGWPYLMCAFTKIHILIKDKKYDEAEKSLAELNEGRKWGDGEYYLRYLEALGDLALAKGDTAKAKESYTKAAAIKTHKGYVDGVQKKLDAL